MSKKSKNKNSQQMAATWAQNYGASGQAMTRGVQNPTRDPTTAAIGQQNTMVANWNAAVTSGRWAAGLQAAGLQGWQQGMINKTIPQLAQRAQVGAAHVQAFLAAWLPAVQSQVQQLPARADYATNKQRMNTLLDWMHSQKGKYKHVWRPAGGGGGFFGGIQGLMNAAGG